MQIITEFKKFAMRGNMLDLAVGIIIGASFGKIVTSLVNDVIMPPIGLLLGGVDFKNLWVTLRGATENLPAVVLRYGQFINTVVDFLIVAFAIFLFIRVVNRMMRKEEKAPEPTTKECPECAMSIPVKAGRCGHCTTVIART